MIQFLLYCLCGVIGVTTDYFIYSFALAFGVWYQSANVLGYLSGTIVSFFLNRAITFSIKDKLGRRFAIFVCVAAIGYSISALLLWIMIDILSMDPKIAKLLTLPAVVIVQYSLNRRITFKERLAISPRPSK